MDNEPMNQYSVIAPKKRIPKKIIIIVASVVVVVIGAVATALLLRQADPVVKYDLETPLRSAAAVMEEAIEKGDGYPAALPADFANPQGLRISGGGSFDGLSYCLTATAVDDPQQQAYISSESTDVRDGSCSTASDLPAPGVVGMPSVSLVGATQITLSWKPASHATKYTVECSASQTFEDGVMTIATKDLSATCNDLTPGTNYFVRVRAENTQRGEWSSVLDAQTSPLP